MRLQAFKIPDHEFDMTPKPARQKTKQLSGLQLDNQYNQEI